MIRSKVMRGLAILLVLSFGLQTFAQSGTNCYPDPPDTVQQRVDELARNIVERNTGPIGKDAAGAFNRVVGIGRFFQDIYLYAVIDGVTPLDEGAPFRTLKAYQSVAETARTDKQVGASARAGGTTTAAEKPSFVDLLGFAIEHGALQKDVNKDSTVLTLSTTPYALIAAAKGDTAENYRKYEFFNRMGLSASFNITDKETVLTNARRRELEEWAVKYRLFGDQSARSERFVKFWNEKIRPKILRRLQVVVAGESLISSSPEHRTANLEALRVMITDPADPSANAEDKARSLNDKIANYLNANQTAQADKKVADIKELILCHLNQFVVGPIRRKEVRVEDVARLRFNAGIVPSLVTAHKELEQARKLLKDFLDELGTDPTTTFAYTNVREPEGHNYQVFKLLYQRDAFRPMKMTANIGFSVYNNPDRTINQTRVRDFAAALSFEGKTESPFTTNTADLSQITYSFTGRYQRMLENRRVADKKADIGTFQFRLEIPFLTGLSLPLSVSYSNATEKERKDGVSFNFGFTLDADKILRATRVGQ